MKIIWAELRRRKVIRVAVAYLVSAWLLIQVGDTLFGMLELPGWTGRALLAALVLGFPLAMVLAWALDMTPEGIVAAENVSPGDGGGEKQPRRFEFSELGDIDLDQLDLGRQLGDLSPDTVASIMPSTFLSSRSRSVESNHQDVTHTHCVPFIGFSKR